MRPHWWAVLAVSLSLLALVAAATSGHPSGPAHHRPEAVAARDGQAGRPPAPGPGTTTTTTAPAPDLGFAPVTSTTLTPAATPAGTPGTIGTKAQVVTKPSSTVPSVPTTTTTAPSAGAVTSTTLPAPQIFTGDLQYPDDPTNSIPFTGSGAMRITVTWPTTPSLSLAVTCPGGSQSNEGPSGISVLIADATGSCDIVLQETQVQFDLVSWKVTIVPTGA
jgi:hypothetical protein